MIREVPLALLPRLWGALEPHFRAALEHHPFLDCGGLLARACAEMATVMAVVDGDRIVGAVAIEVVQYPGRRVGNVLALGGETGSMERYNDEVESYLIEWCTALSLDSLAMLGRPGWGKYLAQRGWQVQPIVCAWMELPCTSRKSQPKTTQPSETPKLARAQ